MHLRFLRRLVLGAAITGAAIGAVPAMASAATTSCSYDAANGGTLTVNDGSGGLPLRISIQGTFIAIDETDTPKICAGSGTFALTTNTNLIKVRGRFSSAADSLIVDQSGGPLGPGTTTESDGSSEVEVNFDNAGGPRGNVSVVGTAQADQMFVGGTLGNVNIGNDKDLDVVVVGGNASVDLAGAGGDDTLSGRGNGLNSGIGATNVRLRLFGGDDKDAIFGGKAPNDILQGDNGSDVVMSNDGENGDIVGGGFGDDFGFVDSGEVKIDSLEHLTFVGPVGSLRMAPRVVKAEAGMISRLKVGWKHPQAWRELRKVKVSLYDGKEAVGTIDVRPAAGRLASTGVVDLKATRCKVRHHGKWVTASLAMRLPKSLADHDLRVDVTATDKHGDKQLVPAAGTIRVR
jgi:hypothetical protein